MIDLHVHTTHSDGQLKVTQILQKAKNERIDVISFCDHNVVGAYEELAKLDLDDFGIKIVYGVEFDFVHRGKDFHILGYNFDWRKLNKSKIIDKSTQEEKIEKQRRYLIFLKEVCRKLHIKIDDNLEIKSPNEKASTILKYHMMEFEENSQILNEMLGKNREKSFARGFVHKQIEYIKEYCRTHNLRISGGSDFHRDGKQRLGYGANGTFEITENYLFKNIER